jgi:hypothetical protein
LLIREPPFAASSAANCSAKQRAGVVSMHVQPCAEGCYWSRRYVTARF